MSSNSKIETMARQKQKMDGQTDQVQVVLPEREMRRIKIIDRKK